MIYFSFLGTLVESLSVRFTNSRSFIFYSFSCSYWRGKGVLNLVYLFNFCKFLFILNLKMPEMTRFWLNSGKKVFFIKSGKYDPWFKTGCCTYPGPKLFMDISFYIYPFSFFIRKSMAYSTNWTNWTKLLTKAIFSFSLEGTL